MIRGTTATFKFKMPHELQYIIWAKVIFWQDGYEGTALNKLPIEEPFYPASNLKEDDPDRTSKELVVVLTGEQTKAFTDQLKARVQVKAMNEEYEDDNGNTVQASTFGSRPQLFTVYPMDDSIIDGEFDEEGNVTKDRYVILSGGNIVSTIEDGDT